MKLRDRIEEKIDEILDELEACLSCGNTEYVDGPSKVGELLIKFKALPKYQRVLVYIGMVIIGLTLGWLIV